MVYLLDSNAWISYMREKSPPLIARVDVTPPEELCLSSIVCFELFYGAYKSAKPDANLALLSKFVQRYQMIEFDQSAADVAAQLRIDLEARGTPIGPYDLLIAATALVHDLTLVTRNSREFGRVSNLRIENWEAN